MYARDAGSAAAPTAGLHFTPELLARFDVERVTLHVGLDTFRPVTEERLDEHVIHGERYAVARRNMAADRAGGARARRRHDDGPRARDARARRSARGTHRALRHAGLRVPPHDALLTNFHLPRSTLLALVMAFAGVDEIRRLYAEAIEERYRFYSFGDAMLIL